MRGSTFGGGLLERQPVSTWSVVCSATRVPAEGSEHPSRTSHPGEIVAMIRALLLGLGLLVAPASGFIRPVSSPRQGLPRLFATSPGTATPNPALLLSPLSGRTVEIFETEDSTERFIQVQFAPDGTFNLVTDSTNAVNLLGTWQQIGDGKLVFVLERFYEEGTSKYSLTRLYEGEFIVAGRSVRGEGKVEMEKYKDVIPVGHFSIITIDDGPDELFDKVTHRDATDGMIEGLDF